MLLKNHLWCIIDSEQASKSLDVDFCTPKTFPGLDIPKVHELVPQCFSVSPEYSHLLMLTAVQVKMIGLSPFILPV